MQTAAALHLRHELSKISLPLQARCGKADKILTGNHWGIAVLLLVAVFVGTEALHKAQVALSQKLARDKANKRSEDSDFSSWEYNVCDEIMSFTLIVSMWCSGGSDSMHKQLVSLSWCWKSRSFMKHSSWHDFLRANIRDALNLIPVWNWKATKRVANKLLIQAPSQFQLVVQTADVDGSSGGTSSDSQRVHSPWTASPAVCGLSNWAWGCCWRKCAAARRAPPSLCSGCLPSERRGWKHTAPEGRFKVFKIRNIHKILWNK